MTTRRALRTLASIALGGLGLVAGLLVAPPAGAAGPPVTAPDAAAVYQGNVVAVLPVQNDHDPDNELLTVCRLGTEHYRGIDVGSFGDEVDISVRPSTSPGVYTFTYYTCDFQTLVPGTISLTVERLPKIKVRPDGRGQIKVKNPFDFKIRFLYGSFDEAAPDAKALINPGATVTLPVERTSIDWTAYNRKGTVFCGTGTVKGIRLRAQARPAAGVPLSDRLARAWRTAG
ncbi:hypothetical protein G5V58_11395 [Nocardioides anomalus]|uniref:Uncharacterized protein n=1 Tax=Nocardioides anomalus TaxID=2712223 RepID=A0A6G6WDQ5_9ACTN|nr:hypothetical protein [Nocardioides anomalus]QIG43283.1 hypothetical protein G5V58_11395 [Nocardioides anomalus]